MTIKPTRNDAERQATFVCLEANFQADADTPEADEMEVLVTLIEAYENKHYPITPPDPIEAIKFRMEQQNLSARDLEVYIGSSGRVSEVLNRKRPLSLRMIKRLHDGLTFLMRVCWRMRDRAFWRVVPKIMLKGNSKLIRNQKWLCEL